MTNCPNCGAPVELKASKCPYCETPYPQSEREGVRITQTLYADNLPVLTIEEYVKHEKGRILG